MQGCEKDRGTCKTGPHFHQSREESGDQPTQGEDFGTTEALKTALLLGPGVARTASSTKGNLDVIGVRDHASKKGACWGGDHSMYLPMEKHVV